MRIPERGAIIRTNYNPPSMRYRVVGIWRGPGQTVSFECHLADDPSGHRGKFYLNDYRLLGERLVGRRFVPGTAGWQALYGRENTDNPEAGDGYDTILIEQHAAQGSLFPVLA